MNKKHTQPAYALIFAVQRFQGESAFYYPEPWVAVLDAHGPAYLERKGTQEVLKSYNIDTASTELKPLLTLVQDMSPAAFESDYNKGQKKYKTLIQLLLEPQIKNTLMRRLDLGFQRFFKLIEGKYDLFFLPKHQVHLGQSKVMTLPLTIEIILKFSKNAHGLLYSMYMQNGEDRFTPSSIKAELIAYQPASLIADNKLFFISDIDGKKIVPFLKKESISIENRHLHDYFSKFIKGIISKTKVEVEGFDYEVVDALPQPAMHFSTGFTQDRYEAIVGFDYTHAKFQYGDPSKNKTVIDVDDLNTIKVWQYDRNYAAEEKIIEIFYEKGFVKSPAFRFYKESEDNFEGLLTIINHLSEFHAAGWKVTLPDIDGKSICSEKYALEVTVETLPDWFDVKAKISIGQHSLPFTALVSQIKKGSRKIILKDGSVFIIPYEWMMKYDGLARFGLEVGDAIKVLKANHTIVSELMDESNAKYSKPTLHQKSNFEMPSMIRAKLRPYQHAGVLWLINHYENGLGACLADDMGLGKTIQTITLLAYVKEHAATIEQKSDALGQLDLFTQYTKIRKPLKALVVVPASLVFNWERELQMFAPELQVKIHSSSNSAKSHEDLIHFDIIITSYQKVVRDLHLFTKVDFEYIIIDEAHYIKNRDSKSFKALQSLSAKCKVSLSGTPIENSLADLWSQMQFINPDILKTYPWFKKEYQDPIEKTKDQAKLDELKKLLNPFILRRTKGEVLADLPDMIEQVHYCTMEEDQAKYNEQEKSKARNEILRVFEDNIANRGFHVLNALMRMRHIANHPLLLDQDSKISSCKFLDVTNTVETLSRAGNKMLLFSSFVSHLNLYKTYFEKENIKYTMLTGEMGTDERATSVDVFQNESSCKVMLISLKAGGTGLNLTAANYVLLLDPWWNPAAEEQAKSRAHRMGQINKVTVIKFITKGSIEEKILKLQESKLGLVRDYFDGEAKLELGEELLKEILR